MLHLAAGLLQTPLTGFGRNEQAEHCREQQCHQHDLAGDRAHDFADDTVIAR
jgi:hypothetical protein